MNGSSPRARRAAAWTDRPAQALQSLVGGRRSPDGRRPLFRKDPHSLRGREEEKMRTIDYKDLERFAGEEIGISDWLEVTQERVDRFAEATGDFQWIHVDVERANREMGGTIAHGYLTLSLVPLLNKSIVEVTGLERALNYGSDKVRFVNMVKVGKRIRMRSKFLSVEPKSGGLQVKTEFTVEIEGEAKPACIAETITLFFPAA
jgi:acyl dehydratase